MRGARAARLGRQDAALAAFRTATELDAGIPGRCSISAAPRWRSTSPAPPLPAFRRAAAAAREDADRGAPAGLGRARGGRGRRRAAAAALRAEALARDPRLIEGLTRAASAAGEDADDEARDEEIALLEAVAPGRRCRGGCP